MVSFLQKIYKQCLLLHVKLILHTKIEEERWVNKKNRKSKNTNKNIILRYYKYDKNRIETNEKQTSFIIIH